MAQARNTENEKVEDRRMGRLDRRANEERRNEDRLSHMKGECRNNVPRRQSDMAGRMIEGELWWSSSRHNF